MKLPRRRFLAGSLAAGAIAGPIGIVRGQPLAFASDPFTLGVASGIPREDSVVLWTRLAPRPLERRRHADAGRGDWEIARRTSSLRESCAQASRWPRRRWLTPFTSRSRTRAGRDYWYRFRAGNAVSPVGRTRTAPRAGSTPRALVSPSPPASSTSRATSPRFATSPTEDLDFVLHLGDYIYEESWGSRLVRQHEVGIRRRSSTPRPLRALQADPDLRLPTPRSRGSSTWDDHEVADDYANHRSLHDARSRRNS